MIKIINNDGSINEVEYDEYGLSKTKGHYEYLSKAERDAIDLQKTAKKIGLLWQSAHILPMGLADKMPKLCSKCLLSVCEKCGILFYKEFFNRSSL